MYNADISICRKHISDIFDVGDSDEIVIKDKPDIVRSYVCYEGITVSLWDKVFKREVLDRKEIF